MKALIVVHLVGIFFARNKLHACHMLRPDLLSSILVVLTHNLYEVSNKIHPPPKYKNANECDGYTI